MRKTPFVNGEFYHIYNRGVDKRNIFMDGKDMERFFQSMQEFNVIEPIGSIYEKSFIKNGLGRETSKLVSFVCYCLNPNHYHFILEQLAENGISEFLKRLGGYTKFFNNRYHRSGSLFEGIFKSIHINSNEYLLYLSVYINLNSRVHKINLGRETSKLGKLSKSSWEEYLGKNKGFCKKGIILDQFNSPSEYISFAGKTLPTIIERKKMNKELEKLLLE